MKNNYQRAKIAIIFMWVSLVIEIVSAYFSYMQITLFQNMNNGIEYTEEVLESYDIWELILGIISAVIALLTLITFLLWFRRAYGNLRTKIDNLTFSKNAVTWAWFIPIVNLYRPYIIMKELYNRTDDYIKENGLATHNIDLSQKRISIWWALSIIFFVVAHIDFWLTLYSENIDDFITVYWLQIILSGIYAFLCIYTVRIIKRYSDAEKILIKEIIMTKHIF